MLSREQLKNAEKCGIKICQGCKMINVRLTGECADVCLKSTAQTALQLWEVLENARKILHDEYLEHCCRQMKVMVETIDNLIGDDEK